MRLGWDILGAVITSNLRVVINIHLLRPKISKKYKSQKVAALSPR